MGSEIRRMKPVEVCSLSTTIYKVLYIPGGARFREIKSRDSYNGM